MANLVVHFIAFNVDISVEVLNDSVDGSESETGRSGLIRLEQIECFRERIGGDRLSLSITVSFRCSPGRGSGMD